MASLLVTGASGFTGQHLCRAAVNAGYDVIAWGQDPRLEGVEAHRVDITEIDSVDTAIKSIKPQKIVHLAAISHVNNGSAIKYYKVNVIGTLNILNSLLRSHAEVENVLVASSAQVYGQPSTPIISEETQPKPINHYGASKYSMENLVNTFMDKIPINIVRPFNYTGPGQSNQFLVPKIVEHFYDKRPTISLGNMDVRREVNHVGNVVRSYLRTIESNFSGKTMNICSGIGRTPQEIIDCLTQITGHEIETLLDPTLVRSNEVKSLVGSTTLMESLIGKLETVNTNSMLTEMLIDLELKNCEDGLKRSTK